MIREKRKSGEVYHLEGVGVLPQKIFVFLSAPDLISFSFSIIFAHFQIKRDFYQGGQNPSVEGPTQRLRGGGGLSPPVCMLKEALTLNYTSIPLATSIAYSGQSSAPASHRRRFDSCRRTL